MTALTPILILLGERQATGKRTGVDVQATSTGHPETTPGWVRDNEEAIREVMRTTSVRTTHTLAVSALVAVLLSLLTGVANAQLASTTVPLVECVTATGAASSPKPFPATRQVSVPKSLANQLAAYSDDQGELYLVAPRGWTCQASVGADGNDSIAVYPPGEVGTSKFALGHNWPKSAQAVTGDILPSCLACYVGQACTFFPDAEKDLVREYGKQITCASLPTREGILRLSPSVISFSDPPGVIGTGEPSGGDFPAEGVVTFKEGTGGTTYGSAMQTCTLPPNEHALCTAVIDAFVFAWQQRAGP
ncbi:MAG TPA: hypothetical protein VEJ84_14480 [Acidimicrobiales bacterium]|nr:hypothetical protein [Acidimicrobiales bacterium]